jgi:hypothetical protein
MKNPRFTYLVGRHIICRPSYPKHASIEAVPPNMFDGITFTMTDYPLIPPSSENIFAFSKPINLTPIPIITDDDISNISENTIFCLTSVIMMMFGHNYLNTIRKKKLDIGDGIELFKIKHRDLYTSAIHRSLITLTDVELSNKNVGHVMIEGISYGLRATSLKSYEMKVSEV